MPTPLDRPVSIGAKAGTSGEERAIIHKMLVALNLDKGISLEDFKAGRRIELESEEERREVLHLLLMLPGFTLR